MMEKSALKHLLRERIGLDPETAGAGLIDRALRARLAACGLTENDMARYVQLVRDSEPEFASLVEEVVVSESWFFRDEQPFALLAERFVPTWLADPDRPPLRVLCAPCAGGEEPYTVAMALMDRGLAPGRFRVIGVDLSRKALTQARSGAYPKNAFRSRDLSFRDRYFEERDGAYHLDIRVMKAVSFRQGNVTSDTFLPDEPRFDAVFCRNLLIYLDEPARKRTLAHLDRLLNRDGLLFLGHAENPGDLAATFRPAGESYCFAFERVTGPERRTRPTIKLPEIPSPRVAPKSGKPTGHAASPGAAGQPRSLASEPNRAKKRSAGQGSIPASVLEEAARPVAAPTQAPDATLERAARLADEGRHQDAAEICEKLIASRGPTSAAFFLLGVIRQALGDRVQAERCFEKAVYLDPAHEEALLALSASARRRGDQTAASNYLRRAENASGGRTTA